MVKGFQSPITIKEAIDKIDENKICFARYPETVCLVT